jgi:ABC-type uncharacterized transport system substrate-binding protein
VRNSFLRLARLTLCAAFLILMMVLLTWFKLTQPRIVVLHSYDPHYEWTRDIDVGLRRVLDSKLRYRVQWHYMDLKNHPDSEFRRRAALLARRAIDTWNPDLIIAVDDDAHKYVVKDFANKPGISIVFAGINGEIEPYGYHKARNVTGILERKSLADIRQALQAMRTIDGGKPIGQRLAHLGDRSDSVQEDERALAAYDWSPLTLVASSMVGNFDEWKAAVRKAGESADVVVISNYRALYRRGAAGPPVPPDEVIEWTIANSKVLLVGMAGFFVEDGGMFAVGASGFEQGDTAARMAIRILDKEVEPNDIPVAMPRQFIVYMRKSKMADRGVTLPGFYESFARATNNYFE